MKFKIIIGVLIAVLLSGCGISKEEKEWNQFKTDKEFELEKGHIKNSEYYISMYNNTKDSVAPNKGMLLRHFLVMIKASYDFEDGKIDKREFESLERSAETKVLIEKDNFDKGVEQKQSQALLNLGQQLERMGASMKYRNQNTTMCPDGSYVSGTRCTLCPNGQYVAGRCSLMPNGQYIGR